MLPYLPCVAYKTLYTRTVNKRERQIMTYFRRDARLPIYRTVPQYSEFLFVITAGTDSVVCLQL